MQEAADLQHAPPAHPLAYPPARVHHALKTRLALGVLHEGGYDAGSAVAAKAGADAPGGGISLSFCREGAQHPPKKPPRSTPPPPQPTSQPTPRPTTQLTLRHTSPAHTPPPRLRQECNHSALSALRMTAFRAVWWGGVAFFSLLYSRGVVPVLERK